MKVSTIHGSFRCELCGQRNLIAVLCTGAEYKLPVYGSVKGRIVLCRKCASELAVGLAEHGSGNAA